MKLISLHAENLKGLSFDLELADVNFFIGGNFKGKSARADAIRLLLLGYLPEQGKRASDTFGLCSAGELLVRGRFDNGFEITRRWWIKGTSIKSEHNVPAELFGDADENPIMTAMLNAEVYFALSERERVKYVFDNIVGLSNGGKDNDGIERRMIEAAAATGAKTDAVTKFLTTFRKLRNTLEVDADFEGWTPQTFIEFAVDLAEGEAKTAKEHAARMTQTAQGLAGLRAADEPEADLNALDAKRLALQWEIAELEASKRTNLAEFERGRAAKRRRIELESEIVRKPARVARVQEIETSIRELAQKIGALPENPETPEAIATEEREVNGKLQTARERARNARQIADERTKALDSIEAQTHCPYCGAAGDGWKAIRHQELRKEIALQTTELGLLDIEIARLKALWESCVSRSSRASHAREERRQMENKLVGLQSELRTAEVLAGYVAKAEEELARLPKESAEITTAVETAQSALNVKNGELNAIEERRRGAMRRANDLQRLAQAEENREAAAADEIIAKAALAFLKKEQAEMISTAMKPILELANELFGAILPTLLDYHDGLIGTWRNGVWVSHKTFSGTEKALCYAAIQAALAARSPIKIMIIDELGRVNNENAAKLGEKVGEAVAAGVLDQFVGIDVARPGLWEGSLELLEDIKTRVVIIGGGEA